MLSKVLISLKKLIIDKLYRFPFFVKFELIHQSTNQFTSTHGCIKSKIQCCNKAESPADSHQCPRWYKEILKRRGYQGINITAKIWQQRKCIFFSEEISLYCPTLIHCTILETAKLNKKSNGDSGKENFMLIIYCSAQGISYFRSFFPSCLKQLLPQKNKWNRNKKNH